MSNQSSYPLSKFVEDINNFIKVYSRGQLDETLAAQVKMQPNAEYEDHTGMIVFGPLDSVELRFGRTLIIKMLETRILVKTYDGKVFEYNSRLVNERDFEISFLYQSNSQEGVMRKLIISNDPDLMPRSLPHPKP